MTHYNIYKAVDELPEDWDTLVAHDILLQSAYLSALERASPKTISLYFIGVFDNDILVGIAIIQRVELYAKDMFRGATASKLKAFFKDAISRILKGNVLVVGNLTHTGQHGVFLKKDSISQQQYLAILFEAINELRLFIKHNKNKSIRSILFKDFFKEDPIHLNEPRFKKNGFYRVNVQPNMLFELRPNWKSSKDYLDDLSSKYKTRYRRARKKLGIIEHRELSLVEMEAHKDRIYRLYENVCNNASFNTFLLPDNHFLSLKLMLGDNFKVFGYYLKNDLVGFYTLILNSNSLETYFLGYDDAYQYENQLYLNMLYDMIDFGIENRFNIIVYARTAMEIKSSVGAKPKAMSMYIKHTNIAVNFMLQSIFRVMNPSQDWQERHPFK